MKAKISFASLINDDVEAVKASLSNGANPNELITRGPSRELVWGG